MSTYQSINSVIRNRTVPPALLKHMIRENRCPGVYAGTRFYVNVPMLEEQLQRESKRQQDSKK